MSSEKIQILDKLFKLYISKKNIEKRVGELAKKIDKDFIEKDLIVIAILNGAFMFTTDLVKILNIDCKVTFVKLSSYQDIKRDTEIKQLIGLNENLKGQDVLIVEDIIDSGNTILQIKEQIKSHNPASISIATLLLKPDALEHDIKSDYVGFEVENKFLVGYGLDYKGYGRGLDRLFVLA